MKRRKSKKSVIDRVAGRFWVVTRLVEYVYGLSSSGKRHQCVRYYGGKDVVEFSKGMERPNSAGNRVLYFKPRGVSFGVKSINIQKTSDGNPHVSDLNFLKCTIRFEGERKSVVHERGVNQRRQQQPQPYQRRPNHHHQQRQMQRRQQPNHPMYRDVRASLGNSEVNLWLKSIYDGNLDVLRHLISSRRFDPNRKEVQELSIQCAESRAKVTGLRHNRVKEFLLKEIPNTFKKCFYVDARFLDIRTQRSSFNSSEFLVVNGWYQYSLKGRNEFGDLFGSMCLCGSYIYRKDNKFCLYNARDHFWKFDNSTCCRCDNFRTMSPPRGIFNQFFPIRYGVTNISIPTVRLSEIGRYSDGWKPLVCGKVNIDPGWLLAPGVAFNNGFVYYGKVAVYPIHSRPDRKYGVQVAANRKIYEEGTKMLKGEELMEYEITNHENCREVQIREGTNFRLERVQPNGDLSEFAKRYGLRVGRSGSRFYFFGVFTSPRLIPPKMGPKNQEVTVGKVIYDSERRKAVLETLFYGKIVYEEDFRVLCIDPDFSGQLVVPPINTVPRRNLGGVERDEDEDDDRIDEDEDEEYGERLMSPPPPPPIVHQRNERNGAGYEDEIGFDDDVILSPNSSSNQFNTVPRRNNQSVFNRDENSQPHQVQFEYFGNMFSGRVIPPIALQIAPPPPPNHHQDGNRMITPFHQEGDFGRQVDELLDGISIPERPRPPPTPQNVNSSHMNMNHQNNRSTNTNMNQRSRNEVNRGDEFGYDYDVVQLEVFSGLPGGNVQDDTLHPENRRNQNNENDFPYDFSDDDDEGRDEDPFL